LTLPLKVGQQCLTRSGARARVLAVDLKQKLYQVVVAILYPEGYEYTYTVTTGGRGIFDQDSGVDLIEDYTEPKLAVWNMGDVPLDAWFRPKGHTSMQRLLSLTPTSVRFHNNTFSYRQLLEEKEYTLDGKTWLPCSRPACRDTAG